MLEAQPDESLDELMQAEYQRERAKGDVTAAAVAVAEHVDPDGGDDDTAHEVRLRRKAHTATLLASAPFPAAPEGVSRHTARRRTADTAGRSRSVAAAKRRNRRPPRRPPAVHGTLESMPAQFIYTMRDLRRFYPPDREVLRGINLSFFPGAKIGVIGANGSGKSSLLKIMAGVDDGFSGEARLTPGFTVGFLSQEPQLDPAKDVLGNVSDGIAATKALVDRFNEVCAAFGEPDADFDALLAEQAELQDKIDAAGAWDLERTFEIAMDALNLPPGDMAVTQPLGR